MLVMPNVMKSILDKSRFANTMQSPERLLRKHFSSNLTNIQTLDKVMRSCSVAQPKNIGDTKYYDTKNDFTEIDEALHSESKATTHKNFIENREQSNTDLEKDIINISEIMDRNKLTKKKILENISFSSSQHDIYNPDFSMSQSELVPPESSESSMDLLRDVISPKEFISHRPINIEVDQKPFSRKDISPIRIRKKPKIKSKLIQRNFETHQQSLISRNPSQNISDKDRSKSKQKNKKHQMSKLYIHGKKKKKMKLSKKKVYDYQPKDQMKSYLDYANANLEIDDNLILASSGKNKVTPFNQVGFDTSTLETGRMKTSYLKGENKCKSVVSIIGSEDTVNNIP